MFCPKCGKQIPDDSSFCMFCGKLIPQIYPEDAPRRTPPAREPVQAPPAPFGEGESLGDFENASFGVELYEEPPAEPETFEPLPEDLELPEPDFGPRLCELCGRELPESNVTGLCVTCTSNRSFVPAGGEDFRLDLDLEDEYPEEYREGADRKAARKEKKAAKRAEQEERKKKRFPLAPVLAAALLMGAAACFAAFYMNGNAPASSASQGGGAEDAQEKEIAGYAQEMVKAKAANPSSVHFDARSLDLSKKNDVWTVKQSFERLAPSGEMAQSSYTAVLKAGGAQGEYKPLMLQVDDVTLYDYR